MSYPQNDFRDYLEHSAKGQTWKDHKYIRKENGRYIYPEDVGKTYKTYNYLKNRNGGYERPESLSDAIDNAQKFSKDARFMRDSIRSRKRFKTRVNALERPIVGAKVKRRKSKVGNVLGRLINRPNGRIVSDLDEKASRRDIEKRRRKLWDNESKRLIKKRKADEDANSIKVQHIVDDMAVRRNSKSLRKPRRSR